MQVITPEEAKKILGTHAVVIEGMSFIMYDTKQFMAHYYHWWGEILLGAMRVYSGLSFLPEYKDTPLPEPARFILPVSVSIQFLVSFSELDPPEYHRQGLAG